MKQIIGTVLGGGLGITTYYAYNAGFFQEVKIEEKKLSEKKIVYFQHEGSYQELGLVFKKLIKESQQYMKAKNIYRIMYDDPYTIQDINKLRSIIGLEFDNVNDENGAKLLIKDKKDYQLATLSETESINTNLQMKQKNFSVVFFLIKLKIQPKIQKYLTEKAQSDKKFKLNEDHRIVEIYKFDDQKNPVEIEFNVPYGEDSKSYNLHSKIRPQHQSPK
ncbi:hypothetical protein ABPG72_011899 [Tetrahymena utriculariae]